MRVLIDIVHPADVLFFLNPIRSLQARGDELLIASRRKDVTCDLLDRFGLDHHPVSTASATRLGMMAELVRRDAGMWRIARRFSPDIMIGLGGISISHAGCLLGVPALGFYAADTATLQTQLTWPFITHLFVPESYAGPTPSGRTSRFPGVKELSYFHPDNFRADDDLAHSNGWEEGRDNFFIRTVAWNANHDIGKSGWSDFTLRALVAKLSALGKVHISSERELPRDLAHHSYRGRSDQVHHVMAKCRLYVGESATMAHEASLMGVPSIYDGADHPGTTRSLQAHGLLSALRQPGETSLLAEVNRLLESKSLLSTREARAVYLANHGSLSQFIVGAIDAHAARPLA